MTKSEWKRRGARFRGGYLDTAWQTRAFPKQAHPRELNRRIAGQVVAGVAIAQKMRIETDDESLPRRDDPGQRGDHVLEFPLKPPDGPEGAVHGRAEEDQSIGGGAASQGQDSEGPA